MSAETEINADPEALVVLDTNAMPWEPLGPSGVSRKVLERVIDPEKGRETALVRLEAGAALPPETTEDRIDVFVLDGRVSDGAAEHGQYTFFRNPAGRPVTLSSEAGCTLYVKRRHPIRNDDQPLVIDTKTTEWLPFGHRAAKVIHFYRDRHGIETARFGELFADKQIPSHDHAMGEETLIVEGTLLDERGSYGPGTWLRFPIGVAHAPYTTDQPCMMLIREGDLVW